MCAYMIVLLCVMCMFVPEYGTMSSVQCMPEYVCMCDYVHVWGATVHELMCVHA